MSALSIDYAIGGVLAIAAMIGLFNGFILSIGAFAGLLLGVWLGGKWYAFIAPWIGTKLGLEIPIANIIAFVVIFFIVSRISTLVFWLLKKIWHMLPLGKFTDHILGMIVGLCEGIIMIGVTLQFAATMPIPKQWSEKIVQSKIAPYMIVSAKLIWPFAEKGITAAKKALQ